MAFVSKQIKQRNSGSNLWEELQSERAYCLLQTADQRILGSDDETRFAPDFDSDTALSLTPSFYILEDTVSKIRPASGE